MDDSLAVGHAIAHLNLEWECAVRADCAAWRIEGIVASGQEPPYGADRISRPNARWPDVGCVDH